MNTFFTGFSSSRATSYPLGMTQISNKDFFKNWVKVPDSN